MADTNNMEDFRRDLEDTKAQLSDLHAKTERLMKRRREDEEPNQALKGEPSNSRVKFEQSGEPDARLQMEPEMRAQVTANETSRMQVPTDRPNHSNIGKTETATAHPSTAVIRHPEAMTPTTANDGNVQSDPRLQTAETLVELAQSTARSNSRGASTAALLRGISVDKDNNPLDTAESTIITLARRLSSVEHTMKDMRNEGHQRITALGNSLRTAHARIAQLEPENQRLKAQLQASHKAGAELRVKTAQLEQELHGREARRRSPNPEPEDDIDEELLAPRPPMREKSNESAVRQERRWRQIVQGKDREIAGLKAQLEAEREARAQAEVTAVQGQQTIDISDDAASEGGLFVDQQMEE